MPSYNKLLLMGHLTRDPEQKNLPSGTVCTEFGIAVNRKFRTGAGEDREEVCFVDCSAFGHTAEVIAEHFTKGKAMFAEGRLKFDQWEKDGQKRSKLSMIVDSFQFVGGRGDANGDGQDDAPPARQQSAPAAVKGQKFHPANKPAAKGGRGPDGPAAPFSSQPEFDPSDIPFMSARR